MNPSASSPETDPARYLPNGPGWIVPKMARQAWGIWTVPRPGLMKIDVFGLPFGLTSGSGFVALGIVATGLPTLEVSAWTRRHRRASRIKSAPTPLPSRFKLGSSDAAATVGRKSTRSSKSSPSDSASASRMFAVVELAGEAKPKRRAKRCKRFGSRTPPSGLNSTHLRTKLKKKVADLPALVDDPSFGEIPAA